MWYFSTIWQIHKGRQDKTLVCAGTRERKRNWYEENLLFYILVNSTIKRIFKQTCYTNSPYKKKAMLGLLLLSHQQLLLLHLQQYY